MDRAGLPLGMMSVAISALMLAAAYCDVRTRRIPNALTVLGFAVAIAVGSLVWWFAQVRRL